MTLIELSVGVTSHAYLLEIQGLFTQGSRHCRTLGESVGGISERDSSDWSNGIRYHTFDARSDTEFKAVARTAWCVRPNKGSILMPITGPPPTVYESQKSPRSSCFRTF